MMQWLSMSVVSLVFIIWIVLIVRRDSPLMALLIVFIWPLAIIPLIQNWGVSGRDIRLPFFLLALSVGGSVYKVSNDPTVDALGAIETLRETDPAAADALDQEIASEYVRAHLEGRSPDVENLPGLVALRASQGASQKAADAEAQHQTAPVDPESEQRAAALAQQEAELANQMQQAVAALAPVPGTIELAIADATLKLPARYRFISVDQTQTLAALLKLAPMNGEVGWVVHEKVDLASKTAWFVRVGFEPGHLTLGNTAELATTVATLNSSGQPQFSQGQFAPTWNESSGSVTWGQRMLWGQHTLKPLAHGTLAFAMQSPLSEPEELGIRATRLLAGRTSSADESRHSRYDATIHGPPRGELAAYIASDRKLQ